MPIAAAIINLRPRTSPNQPLVLPYAPMPRPNPKSPTATAEPPPAMPLNRHPDWVRFVQRLARTLLEPNPHLQPEIYALLEYADSITTSE